MFVEVEEDDFVGLGGEVATEVVGHAAEVAGGDGFDLHAVAGGVIASALDVGVAYEDDVGAGGGDEVRVLLKVGSGDAFDEGFDVSVGVGVYAPGVEWEGDVKGQGVAAEAGDVAGGDVAVVDGV